jgi:hypothetical protein
MFKLTPDAAIRVASSAFLNYAAIPDAAKIMRKIPIIGGPFASFTWATAAHVGHGLGVNPSFYNRVQFFIDEVTGEQTPIEKEKLQTDTYSYLNADNWMKLPFFETNPVYLNMANYFPQYAINFLRDDTNRDVEKEYGGDVGSLVKVLDKLQGAQFMSTPEGRFMLDYLIVPWLTEEAVGRSLNTRGEIVYPEDFDALQKLGLGLGGIANQLTPRVIGQAAALLPGELSPEARQYAPSSYQKTENALEGKTAKGVLGTEDPASRTARDLGSTAGFSTQIIKTHK